MRNRKRNPEASQRANEPTEPGTHEAFLELCALSTSGELSGEEQKTLKAHLADCPECRQALKEFEAAAGIGVPLLHSQLSGHAPSEPGEARAELPKVVSIPSTADVGFTAIGREAAQRNGSVGFPSGNDHRLAPVNWNYVWMSFAAAVVLAAALGIYSYQFGRHRGQEAAISSTMVPEPKVETLEQRLSDAGHEREVLSSQLAQKDGAIAGLQRQIAKQAAELAEVRAAQGGLQRSLQNDETEKQQAAQERNAVLRKLDVTEASLQKSEAELESLRQERSRDQSRSESLEAQIRDLHGQLRDQELELSRQQDLLAHDRDIRELMGARDLYIAEVYDVARDGQTQKPYGRVFYTKGKSLIFYAYDLDQQPGVKNATAFQAWGRRGAGQRQALSLGIFYRDDAAKKRWVLKFDDPQALGQIDGVFVTVEPKGGSQKPSGKALLFASLKIEPNHP